jgi:hypothetical protein
MRPVRARVAHRIGLPGLLAWAWRSARQAPASGSTMPNTAGDPAPQDPPGRAEMSQGGDMIPSWT